MCVNKETVTTPDNDKHEQQHIIGTSSVGPRVLRHSGKILTLSAELLLS